MKPKEVILSKDLNVEYGYYLDPMQNHPRTRVHEDRMWTWKYSQDEEDVQQNWPTQFTKEQFICTGSYVEAQ